ncbi:MAG: carbamoyltransferase HypF [Desulfobacterota bacterium]|nr:carbamoyltransferase HypF [Thermodesulfobacteriota bacterium]MDW8001524.1 carbamoyltransferase HypF [Deltaproteobacteria bacterium]
MAGSSEAIRYLIKVHGTVQGVGFRPYVYQHAREFNLTGKVFNSSEGVVIDVEGKKEKLFRFLELLRKNPPPLAKIENIEFEELPVCNYTSFVIVESEKDKERKALIPPDVATCNDCKTDILNPKDRRYMYPFTNCTNCGPRFTIVYSIPYDRDKTSMKKFVMCSDCEREYHDPKDRRFHAQPTCCPRCGPKVWVANREGIKVADENNWLQFVWEKLQEGKIIALKSLGGFHLACDAKNEDVVQELRLRKRRPKKPFAVMCKDKETVKKYCLLSEEEERLLTSCHAPIVVLKRRIDCDLPDILAPGIKTLGVMLPYTPLHILLFLGPFEVLVMTSGNVSELPIVISNEEAVTKLGKICDFFVFHERDIVNRCDDSVVKLVDNNVQFFRLSRGYVPEPITLPFVAPKVTVGIGGEMKNNICIIKNDKAFMSQYVGEIDTEEGRENLLNCFRNLCRLLDVSPKAIAFDLHPNYLSSSFAKSLPAEIHFGCQHHHAHMVSCMAENCLDEKEVIGVVLDGTGYGTDGNLWGFEILLGNYRTYERLFHLAYCPLPGGEIAIREPWRMAISYLYSFLGEEGLYWAEKIFGKERTALIVEVLKKGFNNPLSSGCGRLFDAVSAMVGLCEKTSYEGQAAIELAELVQTFEGDEMEDRYDFEIVNGVIYPDKVILGVVRERVSGRSAEFISHKFHNTVVEIIKECVKMASAQRNVKRVVLSGGTFHNDFILKKTKRILKDLGLEVYFHTKVPPNDGGIALGQAAILAAKIKEGEDVPGNSCFGLRCE